MTIRAEVRDMRELYNLRQSVQRQRIRLSNQLSAIERGDSPAQPELPTLFMERFDGIEKEIDGYIAQSISEHPAWPWLEKVKGIGPALAGRLLAPIDIERATSVSALWKYAGQGVTPAGERDKPVKGEKLSYNADLKSTCYLIATSFLRASSQYRRFYDAKKAYYQSNRPDWTPKRIDMAAKRFMVKMFLSHLWMVWREAEGLPVTLPYAHDQLGHVDYVGPSEVIP